MDDTRKTKARLIEELRALREENAQLRASASADYSESVSRVLGIFDATSDLVGTADPDGSRVFLNRAGLSMLGREGNARDSDLHVRDLHPESLLESTLNERIPAAIHTGVWAGETALVTKDGREIPASQVIMAHRDATGEVQYISTIARDITKRKRLEETLRENEHTLQALLNAITDPVLLLDLTGKILSINEASAAMLGTRVEEAICRSIADFAAPDDAARRIPEATELLRIRKAVRYEDERHGRVFDIILQPLFDGAGEIARVAVYGRDITEWKRAQNALRQRAASEALVSEVSRRLSLLPESSIDGAITSALESAAGLLDADYAELRQMQGDEPRLVCTHFWQKQHVDLSLKASRELATGAGSWLLRHIGASDYLYCENVAAIADETQEFRDELLQRGVRSFVVLPVRASGVVEGGVSLVWAQRAANLTEAQLAPLVVLGDVILEAQRRKLAEAALRESEERYRLIVEHQTEFIVRALPDGTRTFVNESFLAYFGLTREEAIGSDSWEWVMPEDRESVLAKIASLSPSSPTLVDEHRVLLPNGEERWNQWVDQGFFDENGVLIEVQSVGRDITARKLAELALLDSQERYRSLYDNTPVMLHSTDSTGRLLSVSDYWLKTMGYTREEVLGRFSTEFITEESRRLAEETLLEEFRTNGMCSDVPLQAVKKNGEVIELLLSAIAERDSQGVMTRSLAVSIDVTARRKTEAALHESEAHYWKLLDLSPDSIVIHCEGRVVFANQSAVALFGAERREQLHGIPVLNYVHSRHRDMVQARLARQPESSLPNFVEETLLRIDGTSFDVELAALPFVYEGKPAVQAVFRDITRQKQAAEALRLSEERFRKVFEDGPVGMTIVSPTMAMLKVNAAFCRMLGYSEDEMCSRTIADVTYPEDTTRDVERMQALLEGRISSYQIEKRYVRKDGRVIWGRLTATLVLDTSGGPLYGLGIVEDITDRKESEDALQRNEQRFRSLVQNSADIITILDAEGIIRYETPSASAVLGYPPGYLIGRGAFELVHPDDVECTRDDFEAALRGDETPPTPEFRLLRADGEWIYVESIAANRFGEPGIDGIVVTSRDVSERVAAQKAIVQSERRFRSLVQNASDITTILEQDGAIRYQSPAFYRLLGYNELDVIGKPIFELIHPEDRAQTETVFTQVRQNPEMIRSLEVRVRSADGEYIVVESVAHNLLSDEGIRGVVINARDITERRRAEEVRGKLEAQVLYAQKLESLGVLAGGIAHDFNNLLTGVLGNADLALTELSPLAPARANILQIEVAARRAADLTRQMLAYSGRGKFVIQSIRLSEVVEEMTHLLEVSISKKCVLRYGFAEDLPAIDGDATQLRQVVMNLIINASESIGERSGVIAVRTGAMDCDLAYLAESYLDEKLPEGVYVYLEVADTGCGMTEEVRAKLFDPFFTTKFTGRGLGLAAVLGIVRSHRGAIKVYSELGVGTTFRVLFPISERICASDLPVTQDAPTWLGSGTILIVDDDETVRALAKKMMERYGFTVMTATDGREGLELFRAHHMTLRAVLLDMTMPHMDGEEAFREMRRITGNVPVVLTSGYSEQDATNRFAGKGLAGFVQKPFRTDDLMAAIRKALGS